MIASIKGLVGTKGENYIVIDVNGIGYKVFVTPKVLEVQKGSNIALHTYLQVREDAMVLFGFITAEELSFFELLITVSGVGPKVALSILSTDNTDLIKSAIANQDAAVFTKIGGVGRKTAEKIIVELKDKVGMLGTTSEQIHIKGSDDVLYALENLGYSAKEIKEVLGKLDHSLPSEEKLRQALKYLSKN